MPNTATAVREAVLTLTPELVRQVFPEAPQAVRDAFVDRQEALAGITDTRARLAYCFANLHAETSGFSIKNLTENINYTADRMAAVWPNRFKSAADVKAKYGTAPGWQKKAFDDIYGNRMGNRPGTSDGSTFIGRGGPQITGRDGYAEISKRIGVDFVRTPELATKAEYQPAIAAAYWDWKGMNRFADAGDFIGCVKAWNGGTNGLTERQRQLARINAILVAVPVTVPPLQVPDPTPIPQPAPKPSVWAAFFMSIVNLFKGSK